MFKQYARSVIRTLVMVTLAGFVVASFQNCSPLRANVDEADSSTSTPGAALLTDDPLLRAAAISVIDAKCGACHQADSQGGVSQIEDLNHLVNSGLVVPGDPTKGRLIGAMTDQSMPPGSPMTVDDIQKVKDWVSSIQ